MHREIQKICHLSSRFSSCRRISSSIPRTFNPKWSKSRFHAKLARISDDEVDLDAEIVKTFDHIPHQASFSKSSSLLGLQELKQPKSCVSWAKETLGNAQKIVDEVCKPNQTIQERKRIVKRLDRLSDEICAVVDAAEVIRNIHPDKNWCMAADEAHQILSNYLNQLNTHVELYQALKDATGNPEVSSSWSLVEKRVADLLLADFEKSGIHMPPLQRNRFVQLHDQILRLGHQFTQQAHSSCDYVDVPGDAWDALRGLPTQTIRALAHGTPSAIGLQGKTRIPIHSGIAHTILSQCRNEQVRKLVYMGMNSGDEDQIATLEKMLRLRADLATLLGKSSFAEVFLADKMASTPEKVMNFLQGMSEVNMPKVRQDVARLSNMKAIQGESNHEIYAWDRQFYTQLLPASQKHRHHMDAPHMPLQNHEVSHNNDQEMTVGIAIAGISRLLTLMYGIRLQPVQPLAGEVWHRDVVRLDAVHETEGKVGTIYCDLYSRSGARKYENAAHFTVQCSRRTDWDREDEQLPTTNDGSFKLPIVVLVTNFSKTSKLAWGDVETLFHEMGHAVHSLLARTEFQHISGTRCQMDFVEVPSILMEYLLRHVGIPGHHVPPWDPDPLDIQTQIRLAILDQLYHSEIAKNGLDSTEIYHQVTRDYDVIPPVPGTAWQVQFGHLFSYGCSYYTYLWSRKWASRIFDDIFRGKQLGDMRSGGDLLRKEMLSVGGGKDGWEVLSGLGISDGTANAER